MDTHSKVLMLMVSAFGIGCIITILVSLNLPAGTDDGLPEEVPVVEIENRVARCGRLHPNAPGRYWDDELEVYLPINWGWLECIGVGRQ